MELSLRHICGTIIEMTVEDMGTTITSNVTNLNNLVPEELIFKLREIADELEEHNQEVKDKQIKL